ncbi:MAG: DUF4256 domain-containing protein [Anaerolineales bacterium]|jgi:hypothetical protein
MAKNPSKGSGKPIPKVEFSLDPSPAQREELLVTLKDRFERNMNRHRSVEWANVQARLEKHPEKLSSLFAMESTGGEPDVVVHDDETDEYVFTDCSEQSPEGRRSICYDGDGQEAREKKGVHPAGNAVDLSAAMGIELLDEDQYMQLQQLGEFDTRSESWLQTPESVRELGGAIFGDRRYGRVFVFHNSAPSFYSARGFRGSLRV